MEKSVKWAFILDKDEFVRLSLNKILKKYGFQVEEIDDLFQLEKRKKDVDRGMILADIEIDLLEKVGSFIKKMSGRFILMTPLVTNELTIRLKKMGIYRIIKKPVDPRLLKKSVKEISFPNDNKIVSLGKKGENPYFIQKGGEV